MLRTVGAAPSGKFASAQRSPVFADRFDPASEHLSRLDAGARV
jgi:hypothetical protein